MGGSFLESPGNHSSADLLHGHVLHVEAHVVAGQRLREGLVVHLHGLHLGGDVGGEMVTTMPGFRIPVSTRPTGTVPIPVGGGVGTKRWVNTVEPL